MTDLSATARRLDDVLHDLSKRRIPLAEIRRAFLSAAPDALAATDQRDRLALALEELARHRRLILPSSSASWDRTARPPLPRSVLLPAAPNGGKERPDATRFPWRPELRFATSLRLDERDFDVLRKVNAWLRDRPTPRRTVPARERSIEVFGDEKAIDRLSGTRLFGAERVTYELLACEPLSPPFVWRSTGEGRTLLVVENHDSFHSLALVLAKRASPVSMVAYGAGRAFCRSVAHAASLDPVPSRILYFGDIDLPGIQIPVRADRVARRAGLPSVEPAVILYQQLLDVGRPTPSKHPARPAEVEVLLPWLPAPLHARAREILSRGDRIAQEWLGLDRLEEDAEWHTLL